MNLLASFKFNLSILISVLQIVFVSNLSAQTSVSVSVSNFKFSPSSVAINVGDTVKWTNTEGTHSVDGTTTTFPNNLASFGNSAGGPGWAYSFVFNTAGSYNYNCGVHPASMTGTITVGSTTAIGKVVADKKRVSVFPNPAATFVVFEISEVYVLNNIELNLFLYNLNGKEVKNNYELNKTEVVLDIQNLPKGVYLYKLMESNKPIQSGKIVKE